MRVTICGPNLNDQSRGTFHVHAEGCGDLRHYGPGTKFGGHDNDWAIEASSAVDVVWAVYDNQLDELGEDEETTEKVAESWVSDFHFAPCVKLEGLRR